MGPGVTEAGMQAATLHSDIGAGTGLPACSTAASSDSSNRQSHDAASVRSSAIEPFTQQSAVHQPAFASDPSRDEPSPLAEAHATSLSSVAAPAAAGLQADEAKGSADFVLTAAGTEGKQQVMENVYLASPQVLAGLAASASGPSDAGHDAPQLNSAAAITEATLAAADTVADNHDAMAISLAVSKAPEPPAPAEDHFPALANTSTTAALSPHVGPVAKDGLARRQDEHALDSKTGFSWSEQPQSSFQTLPFVDSVGSHSNILPLPAGMRLCGRNVLNDRPVGAANRDLFSVQLHAETLSCCMCLMVVHLACAHIQFCTSCHHCVMTTVTVLVPTQHDWQTDIACT